MLIFLQSTKIMIKEKKKEKKMIEFNKRLMSNMVLIICLKMTEQLVQSVFREFATGYLKIREITLS